MRFTPACLSRGTSFRPSCVPTIADRSSRDSSVHDASQTHKCSFDRMSSGPNVTPWPSRRKRTPYCASGQRIVLLAAEGVATRADRPRGGLYDGGTRASKLLGRYPSSACRGSIRPAPGSTSQIPGENGKRLPAVLTAPCPTALRAWTGPLIVGRLGALDCSMSGAFSAIII